MSTLESTVPFTLLVVTPRGMAEHLPPIQGRVTIGRGEDNAVRVEDPSVSRRHAALDIGETMRLEDLGGVNGTYVQRRRPFASGGETESFRQLRLDSVLIGPGDRIVLGAAQLFLKKAHSSADPHARTEAPFVTQDPRMAALFEQAERVAASRVSVLLSGETGVGKEVVAKRIHALSPRSEGPFVAINCAALPETLLEAELFGAEKGAYTGATQARQGLFETADKGTLFLDEIGDLAHGTQAKLLRVLEDRKVLRVGSRSPRDVDVRFIAATNRDLKRAVDSGAFRADLFFRLAGVALSIPPLRERPTEIEPLARALLDRACREIERTPLDLSQDVLDALARYSWPGNVRELKNAMDHAAVLCPGPRLGLPYLPTAVLDALNLPPTAVPPRPSALPPLSPAALPPLPHSTAPPAGGPGALKEEVRGLERERILEALERCHGNQTRAAELLGVSRRTLINRLDEYDIGRPRKR